MTFFDLFVHAECGSCHDGALNISALFCYKGVGDKLQALICGVYPVSNLLFIISLRMSLSLPDIGQGLCDLQINYLVACSFAINRIYLAHSIIE